MSWLIRRFRWVILGWVAKFLTRIGLKRSFDQKVDQAKADLEQRLPSSVVKAADKLPGDIVRAGGAAVVASQASRVVGGHAATVGSAAKRAIASGASVSSTVRTAGLELKNAGSELANEIRHESDQARREMKSDIARQSEGDAAALEALLDLRDLEAEPLPEVGDPIAGGRRRFRPSLPAAPVNRMQRSYRQSVRPWDRGARGKDKLEPSERHRKFNSPD